MVGLWWLVLVEAVGGGWLCWWVEAVGCGFVVVMLLGNGGGFGG